MPRFASSAMIALAVAACLAVTTVAHADRSTTAQDPLLNLYAKIGELTVKLASATSEAETKAVAIEMAKTYRLILTTDKDADALETVRSQLNLLRPIFDELGLNIDAPNTWPSMGEITQMQAKQEAAAASAPRATIPSPATAQVPMQAPSSTPPPAVGAGAPVQALPPTTAIPVPEQEREALLHNGEKCLTVEKLPDGLTTASREYCATTDQFGSCMDIVYKWKLANRCAARVTAYWWFPLAKSDNQPKSNAVVLGPSGTRSVSCRKALDGCRDRVAAYAIVRR